jgi:hypothetical protein
VIEDAAPSCLYIEQQEASPMALILGYEGQRKLFVQELADHFHRPKDEIEPVFNEEYEKVDRSARVKTFVGLFATRHARERIQKESPSDGHLRLGSRPSRQP